MDRDPRLARCTSPPLQDQPFVDAVGGADHSLEPPRASLDTVSQVREAMEPYQQMMVECVDGVKDLIESELDKRLAPLNTQLQLLHERLAALVGVRVPSSQDPTHSQSSARVPASSSTGVPTLLKPKPFDGSVEWSAYQRQFEGIARENHWSENTMASALSASLTGPALTVLTRIDFPCTYDDLVKALQARFGNESHSQLSITLLNARTQLAKESIKDYHQALQDLAWKAWPGAAYAASEGQTVFQFMRGLRDEEVRRLVVSNWPASMAEALSVALKMEAAVKMTTGPSLRSAMVEDNPKPAYMVRTRSSPPSKRPWWDGSGKGRQVICWRCDTPGHTWFYCPTRKSRKQEKSTATETGNESRSD